MSGITVFVILATLATFGILVAGGISMSRGGGYDRTHAFPLMEAEVMFQAIVLGLVAIGALFW